MVWARACGRGLLGVLARWALGAERLACARARRRWRIAQRSTAPSVKWGAGVIRPQVCVCVGD